MRWSELLDIVRSLEENYVDEEIDGISLVDLHEMVINLPDFADDPEDVNQEKLQEIYDAWLDSK